MDCFAIRACRTLANLGANTPSAVNWCRSLARRVSAVSADRYYRPGAITGKPRWPSAGRRRRDLSELEVSASRGAVVTPDFQLCVLGEQSVLGICGNDRAPDRGTIKPRFAARRPRRFHALDCTHNAVAHAECHSDNALGMPRVLSKIDAATRAQPMGAVAEVSGVEKHSTLNVHCPKPVAADVSRLI